MATPIDVSIAGELNLDLIFYGLPVAMPLEREVLADDFAMTLGSSSAIVAHNLASLGMKVSFQSVIGDDVLGKCARSHLAASGVEISGVKELPGRQTGVTVLLPHGGQRHILTYPGTIADLSVRDLDVPELASARHFHLSSLYLQRGLHDGLVDLLGRLKRGGMTISLDPNDDPEDAWGGPLSDVLPFVDIFMPNESELCRMTQCPDLSSAAERMRQYVPTLVVKRGAHGAVVVSGDSTWVAEGLRLPQIVDTVGAGDSFDAGFLAAFLSGKDLASAARCGNLCGALSTQGRGGVEAFELDSIRGPFLEQWDPDGILGREKGF